jgi:hypothetical protein
MRLHQAARSIFLTEFVRAFFLSMRYFFKPKSTINPRLHLKLNDFWQFTRLRCGSLRASRISGGSDAGARGADDAGSPTWPSSSVTAVNYSAAGEEAEIGFKVHPYMLRDA